MKKLALMTALFIATSFMSSCGNNKTQDTGSKTQTSIKTQDNSLPKGVYYTCEMHRDVHLDKPGDCPKCGMKLVRSDSLK